MIFYAKNSYYVILATYYKLIKKLWPIVVATIIPTLAYDIAITWILLIILAIYSFLKWKNEYIVINDEYLIYKSGILEKEEINIPLINISLVEFERNIIHKILGLNKVKIESVSPKDKSFNITMILSNHQVSNFKEAFSHGDNIIRTKSYNIVGKRAYKMSKKHLPLLLTLKSNLILGVVTIYTAFKVLESTHMEIINYIKYVSIQTIEIWISERKNIFIIILLTLVMFSAIIFIIMLASLLGVINRYYKFQTFRKNNYIYIEYGLIVRRRYSIAIENIHAIKFEQNIINQVLDLYTIKCFAVGYGEGYKEDSVVFPLCNKEQLEDIVKELFPEFEFNEAVNIAPKRARNNFFTSWIMSSIGITLIIYLLINSFTGIILVLVTFLWRFLVRKNSMVGIGGKVLFISTGSFSKSVYIIKNYSVMEWQRRANVFQRRKKICDYKVEFYSKRKRDFIKVKNQEDYLFEKLKNKITI